MFFFKQLDFHPQTCTQEKNISILYRQLQL